MAELTDIREALADNLDAIPGLQASPYLLSNPTPPSAEVVPSEIEYDLSFQRGGDLWKFTVRVMVGVTTDKGAQKRLDRMLASSGANSVKRALESDPTLDGTVDDVRAVSCTGYRIFGREGGAALLGAEWNVEVLASG